jgi:hypothetical protein
MIPSQRKKMIAEWNFSSAAPAQKRCASFQNVSDCDVMAERVMATSWSSSAKWDRQAHPV